MYGLNLAEKIERETRELAEENAAAIADTHAALERRLQEAR